MLNRFSLTDIHQNIITKHTVPIIPDETLVLNYNTYNLKSVVYHHGDFNNNGHYTADIIHSVGNTKYMVNTNDGQVFSQIMPTSWSITQKKTCYMLFYEQTKPCDTNLAQLLVCIAKCEGFCKILQIFSNIFDSVDPQRKLLKIIEDKNVSECLQFFNNVV